MIFYFIILKWYFIFSLLALAWRPARSLDSPCSPLYYFENEIRLLDFPTLQELVHQLLYDILLIYRLLFNKKTDAPAVPNVVISTFLKLSFLKILYWFGKLICMHFPNASDCEACGYRLHLPHKWYTLKNQLLNFEELIII